jgi:hypothetical protein
MINRDECPACGRHLNTGPHGPGFCTAEDDRTAAWLIEKTQAFSERERRQFGKTERYFAWHPFLTRAGGGGPRHMWTNDVHEAARFATREEAEGHTNGDPSLMVAEHLFGLGDAK